MFARKVLDVTSSQNSQFPDEFRPVAKLCNGAHENIIEVIRTDYVQHPGPQFHRVPFIDMELCHINLKQFNHRHWEVANAYYHDFFAKQAWKIIKQIADGLVFIHANEYVHRDLKPENGIILDLTCCPDLHSAFRTEGWEVEDI